MVYFKFPFSENICTTDSSSTKKWVSFFSFDGSEILPFEGDIKQISQQEFLKNEINTHFLSFNLNGFEEENQNDYQEKN